MPDPVTITAKSVGVVVGYVDEQSEPAVLLQQRSQRSQTNQKGESKPQSYPGGSQLTAHMKVGAFRELTVPDRDALPPPSIEDSAEVLKALRKECGEAATRLVQEAAGATQATIGLLLQAVNENGRLVQTFGVRIDKVTGGPSSFRRLLAEAKPVEIRDWTPCTAEQAKNIRVFTPADKTPVQEGGREIPPGEFAMFADDKAAVELAFERLFTSEERQAAACRKLG